MSAPDSGRGRLLLVVSGGIEATRGLRLLRERGWKLAVLDGDPEAPGFELADEVLKVSTYDLGPAARAASELHARRPLSGVMSIAADVPHTVAHIARTLGLPGLEPETARLAMDKLAMKERFRRAGVPIPLFEAVSSVAELARALRELGGRLVLKPVDSRGARGVLLLDEASDLAWAFEHSRTASPSQRVMVEEFLPGPQLSSESIVLDGRAYTSGLSDRNYALLARSAPFMIEDGGDQPSALRASVGPKVDALIAAAAAAIGLEAGVLKGDLVLDGGGDPVVIEVAPRLSGGYFCTDQIPLSTGVQLVELQARIAVGERPAPEELTPSRWSSTCIRYFFPPQGRILAIDGFEAMREQPWVEHSGLFVAPGERVAALTDHTRRAGFVLVTGSTPSEARTRAEQAVSAVRFTIEEPARAGVPQTGLKPSTTDCTTHAHTSDSAH